MTRNSLHSLVMFLVIASLSAVLAFGLVACGDGDDPTDGDADGDAGGDTPDGDTPDGDTPDGDTPDGDTPDGDTPDGDTPDGDEPDGDVDGDLDIDTDFDANMTDFERCVAQSCGDEMDTCMANTDCASLLDCVSSCEEGQDGCEDACFANNPDGEDDFGPLLECAETYCSEV